MYLDNMDAIAREDVYQLRQKDKSYGSSWKRRGGVGAFMMLARKWDRLEAMLGERPDRWDILSRIGMQAGSEQGDDGTVLAEVRDLRRYLLLVEAEMVEQGAVELPDPGIIRDRGTRTYESMVEMVRETGGEVLLDVFSGVNKLTPGVTRPGTPEDGGHHALAVDRMEDGSSFMPAGWASVAVPFRGRTYFNVDRRVHFEETEHLPELLRELNHKEWEETADEYRGMYRWEEDSSKWLLLTPYLDHWTHRE